MFRECPRCGLAYFRESGYYVGAMIINYALTAVVVTAAYLLLLLVPDLPGVPHNAKIALWLAFAVVVSLSLMQHSYSFWLALDFWLDPWKPQTPSTASLEDRDPGGDGR